MTLKKAKELYKKAHIGLTPSEEDAAHEAEKLLKKKKITAKRNGEKFFFSDKKKLKEQKDFYSSSGEVHPITGEIIHEPEPVSRKDKLMKLLRNLLKKKQKQKPSNERLPF